MSDWISSNNPPKQEGVYIVALYAEISDFACYYPGTGFGFFYNGKWNSVDDEVTHWMPMPEPPEVKEND